MMNLAVYVNYPGNCEDAFRYYREHLGAVPEGAVTRHGDTPNPNIPADWSNRIMHARLRIGSTILMGADIPRAEPMRSCYLTFLADSDTVADGVYDALSDGGEVFMEMQTTPFARRFAMLRDRFGANWMLLRQA